MTVSTDPYELLPSDPHHRKNSKLRFTRAMRKHFNRGNMRKYLTKPTWSDMLKTVIRLIVRKDDKVAKDKNKKLKRSDMVTIFWLVETSFRFYTGWLLITKFHYFIAFAVGLYAMLSAFAIVSHHFLRANKK